MSSSSDNITCCIIRDGDSYDEYEYNIEHHWWDLSCGHTVLTLSGEEKPKYCTECGRNITFMEKDVAECK